MSVWVTGAASGIGRATVELLLQQGHSVWAVDRDGDALADLACSDCWGDQLRWDALDLRDELQLRAAYARELERAQAPEFLVHAAGILHAGSLLSFRRAQLQELLEVQVLASLTVLQLWAGGLLARGAKGAGVVVSSNAGRVPRTQLGAYGASKAGLSMLTRAMALELAPRGLRLNVVLPGSTRTKMLTSLLGEQGVEAQVAGQPAEFRLGIPLGRLADAEDIAELCVFLLSDKAKHLTLQELTIDGGASLL